MLEQIAGWTRRFVGWSWNFRETLENTLVQSWFFWLGTHFWVCITFCRMRYNVRLIIIIIIDGMWQASRKLLWQKSWSGCDTGWGFTTSTTVNIKLVGTMRCSQNSTVTLDQMVDPTVESCKRSFNWLIEQNKHVKSIQPVETVET